MQTLRLGNGIKQELEFLARVQFWKRVLGVVEQLSVSG